MSLTQKQTISAIRKLGASVKYSSEWREYRVNIPGGNEATAYYTDDPEDALGTAKQMMKQYHHKKKRTFNLFGA